MKEKLLKRLIHQKYKKYIFFPLDHGFYKSPDEKLLKINKFIKKAVNRHVGSIMIHKGLYKTHKRLLRKANYPFFIHITGSTGLFNPIRKVQVTSVKEAKDFGAIGISALVYLGNKYESEMLQMLGKVCESADHHNLLIYIMMYVSDYKNNLFKEKLSITDIKWAARVAYEMGVDIVEIRYPEKSKNLNSIKPLCPIPLILGDRSGYSEQEYTNLLKNSIQNGFDGVSVSNRTLTTPFDKLLNLTYKGFYNPALK